MPFVLLFPMPSVLLFPMPSVLLFPMPSVLLPLSLMPSVLLFPMPSVLLFPLPFLFEPEREPRDTEVHDVAGRGQPLIDQALKVVELPASGFKATPPDPTLS